MAGDPPFWWQQAQPMWDIKPVPLAGWQCPCCKACFSANVTVCSWCNPVAQCDLMSNNTIRMQHTCPTPSEEPQP
jgi:hypothetical protein